MGRAVQQRRNVNRKVILQVHCSYPTVHPWSEAWRKSKLRQRVLNTQRQVTQLRHPNRRRSSPCRASFCVIGNWSDYRNSKCRGEALHLSTLRPENTLSVNSLHHIWIKHTHTHKWSIQCGGVSGQNRARNWCRLTGRRSGSGLAWCKSNGLEVHLAWHLTDTGIYSISDLSSLWRLFLHCFDRPSLSHSQTLLNAEQVV